MAEPINVLVVDDNEDLLETLALILKRRGFNVDTATDGEAAVAKYAARSFDVALMDIVMPHMNGVEAFQKIREMDPGAAVILMTAYSEEDLIRTALDGGAHRIVHKPISIDQMIALLKEAAQGQAILLVDDDEDILGTLSKAFEIEGYRVMAAGSGEEAVKLAQERQCQIAFVDVKLPLMDGLETYLRLKEINPNITTVMMTGFRDEVKDALEKAQEAQAIDCLFKPFSPVKALEMVSQLRGNKACTHDGRQKEHPGC
ncbi:MAG: response regulator [Dehalococcoidales bacterium]|nr:response regulator [Dehalococcoidales bacterium]